MRKSTITVSGLVTETRWTREDGSTSAILWQTKREVLLVIPGRTIISARRTGKVDKEIEEELRCKTD